MIAITNNKHNTKKLDALTLAHIAVDKYLEMSILVYEPTVPPIILVIRCIS